MTLMGSHALDTATTAYPGFSHSHYAYSSMYSSASLSHHRVRTYTAHALLLFDIYGVLLSSGLWLEYYFTSHYPSTSLLTLSSIFGAQLACLGLSASITASLQRRWRRHWRLHMSLGGLSVCAAHLGLLISDHLWVVVLCQGVLTGLGLGVLYAVSVRVLSSHYKDDMAVASTSCEAAGCFGTAVYTMLAWVCLRSDDVKTGYGIMTALLASTILPAILVAKPCALQSPHAAHLTRPPRLLFPFLTLLIPTSLFLPPLLVPLTLTRHPTPHRANSGPYIILSLSVGALLSSSFLPKLPPHRLSPPTLVCASSLLCGIALVPLLSMPSLPVAVPCAVIFGAGMGGVFVLYVKLIVGLVGGAGQRSAVLLTGGGLWRDVRLWGRRRCWSGGTMGW
ncbi:MFS monocarboxylate [Stagonosporopsis vannaccii]|nr:MFS monocarboxylate [Stagonosporopsis vannaccii]